MIILKVWNAGLCGRLHKASVFNPVLFWCSFVERLELIKSRHMASQEPLKVVPSPYHVPETQN